MVAVRAGGSDCHAGLLYFRPGELPRLEPHRVRIGQVVPATPADEVSSLSPCGRKLTHLASLEASPYRYYMALREAPVRIRDARAAEAQSGRFGLDQAGFTRLRHPTGMTKTAFLAGEDTAAMQQYRQAVRGLVERIYPGRVEKLLLYDHVVRCGGAQPAHPACGTEMCIVVWL